MATTKSTNAMRKSVGKMVIDPRYAAWALDPSGLGYPLVAAQPAEFNEICHCQDEQDMTLVLITNATFIVDADCCMCGSNTTDRRKGGTNKRSRMIPCYYVCAQHTNNNTHQSHVFCPPCVRKYALTAPWNDAEYTFPPVYVPNGGSRKAAMDEDSDENEEDDEESQAVLEDEDENEMDTDEEDRLPIGERLKRRKNRDQRKRKANRTGSDADIDLANDTSTDGDDADDDKMHDADDTVDNTNRSNTNQHDDGGLSSVMSGLDDVFSNRNTSKPNKEKLVRWHRALRAAHKYTTMVPGDAVPSQMKKLVSTAIKWYGEYYAVQMVDFDRSEFEKESGGLLSVTKIFLDQVEAARERRSRRDTAQRTNPKPRKKPSKTAKPTKRKKKKKKVVAATPNTAKRGKSADAAHDKGLNEMMHNNDKRKKNRKKAAAQKTQRLKKTDEDGIYRLDTESDSESDKNSDSDNDSNSDNDNDDNNEDDDSEDDAESDNDPLERAQKAAEKRAEKKLKKKVNQITKYRVSQYILRKYVAEPPYQMQMKLDILTAANNGNTLNEIILAMPDINIPSYTTWALLNKLVLIKYVAIGNSKLNKKPEFTQRVLMYNWIKFQNSFLHLPYHDISSHFTPTILAYLDSTEYSSLLCFRDLRKQLTNLQITRRVPTNWATDTLHSNIFGKTLCSYSTLKRGGCTNKLCKENTQMLHMELVGFMPPQSYNNNRNRNGGARGTIIRGGYAGYNRGGHGGFGRGRGGFGGRGGRRG